MIILLLTLLSATCAMPVPPIKLVLGPSNYLIADLQVGTPSSLSVNSISLSTANSFLGSDYLKSNSSVTLTPAGFNSSISYFPNGEVEGPVYYDIFRLPDEPGMLTIPKQAFVYKEEVKEGVIGLGVPSTSSFPDGSLLQNAWDTGRLEDPIFGLWLNGTEGELTLGYRNQERYDPEYAFVYPPYLPVNQVGLFNFEAVGLLTLVDGKLQSILGYWGVATLEPFIDHLVLPLAMARAIASLFGATMRIPSPTGERYYFPGQVPAIPSLAIDTINPVIFVLDPQYLVEGNRLLIEGLDCTAQDGSPVWVLGRPFFGPRYVAVSFFTGNQVIAKSIH